jgi:hypothetical protein
VPTREEITQKLYGDALRRLTKPAEEDLLFVCVHLREAPGDGMFICPLHMAAGMLCRACIGDHGWTHRQRGCDNCGAADAPWDAMPVYIRPPLPADVASNPMTEWARPTVHLLGPALCERCAGVFQKEDVR